MKILVLNAGSSSLKYSLFVGEDSHLAEHGIIEHLEQEADVESQYLAAVKQIEEALSNKGLLASLGDCEAVGHRVVHGGELFHQATLIDEQVMDDIEALSQLAPLHNPVNLLPIESLYQHYPQLTQIAVFDTAFHQTLPDYAFHYALPEECYLDDHIRRYGFHGTSHQYICKQFAQLHDLPLDEVNIISCHLGNGASICAIEQGESIDTSMGFTPLEGLVMGTRSGDLDPSIPLYLMQHKGYSAEEVSHLLNHQSGLLGLTGESDMRQIIHAADQGIEAAQLALDIFVYRINKIAGGYLAVMDQIDGLVFTGGIGEHSAFIRELIIDGFSSRLNLHLDYELNERAQHKTCVSQDNSDIPIWVIATDEEQEIAQQCLELLEVQV